MQVMVHERVDIVPELPRRQEISGDFESAFLDIKDIGGRGSGHPLVREILASSELHPALGRTAIRWIFEDIESRHVLPIKRVYLPSYLCDSMLDPIVEMGFEPVYYTVRIDGAKLEYEIDTTADVDAFFAMSYFGFQETWMDDEIQAFRRRGVCVIEDATHRFLSSSPFGSEADYILASLRKWFPIPCGAVALRRHESALEPIYRRPIRILEPSLTFAGMEAKRAYLTQSGGAELKEHFRTAMAESAQRMTSQYHDLCMDRLSLGILWTSDWGRIRSRRQRNSEFLRKRLNENFSPVRPLVSESNPSVDCPLFMTVVVEQSLRPSVLRILRENHVYAPVHRPAPTSLAQSLTVSDVYTSEFSLVCDQRYGIDNLNRVVSILEKFEESYGRRVLFRCMGTAA